MVKDRNYLISFKANADAARSIGLRILQNASPFSTIFSQNVNITTTQTTYGTYAYTSTYTGSVALRFFLGNSSIPVYFDDVIMIEEASITLPVTLVSFTGTLTGDKAVLNWKTATELNVNSYLIEKSKDAIAFLAIGNVPARNSLSGSTYSFSDIESIKGQVYYRLKTVDKDGSFRYSKVVTIKAEASGLTTVKIFPNPVTTSFTVSYPAASEKATLSIVSADGKRIAEYIVAVGSIQRSVDVSELGAGQYFIIYKNGNQTTSGSFIK